MDKEFQEITAQREKLEKTIKSVSFADMNPEMRNMYDQMCGMINNIYSYADYLYKIQRDNHEQLRGDFQNHKKGHVPAMTPSQMKKHLENIGAEDDYEISKPTINMAKSGGRLILEASYTKK